MRRTGRASEGKQRKGKRSLQCKSDATNPRCQHACSLFRPLDGSKIRPREGSRRELREPFPYWMECRNQLWRSRPQTALLALATQQKRCEIKCCKTLGKIWSLFDSFCRSSSNELIRAALIAQLSPSPQCKLKHPLNISGTPGKLLPSGTLRAVWACLRYRVGSALD